MHEIQQQLQVAACEYEITAVNDGSTDSTDKILRSPTEIRACLHHNQKRIAPIISMASR